MALARIITETCGKHFGPPKKNGCGTCPLRSPCVTWGAKPARTLDELHRNADEFAVDAEKLHQEGRLL
jgi:hypothetical protein